MYFDLGGSVGTRYCNDGYPSCRGFVWAWMALEWGVALSFGSNLSMNIYVLASKETLHRTLLGTQIKEAINNNSVLKLCECAYQF